MTTGCAFLLTVGSAARLAPPPGMQLADMGMGADGPQLGGSQDDMIVTDPGHEPRAASDMITGDPGHDPAQAGMIVSDPGTLPAAPDMIVTDPGHEPPPAQMDVGTPMDDGRQDYIE